MEFLKMIKKTISSVLFVCFLIVLQTGALELAPYYNYQLGQGVSVSPDGDWGFMANLSNEIGVIARPIDDHSIMGYYSLSYQGPGLKQQEGRDFRERYLNHVFVGRHHWHMRDMTLKTQFSVMMERRRAGTNESWESGLYNFNRYGGSTTMERELLGIDSAVTVGYHYVTFPNYSDLLAEIRAGADASGTEGTQNNHSIRLAYSADISGARFGISLNPLFYTRQKVAVDKVQKDGSFYSDTLQRDMVINAYGRGAVMLTNRIVSEPGAEITFRSSNQNYQHFEFLSSTAPMSFHENFFNYIEPSLTMPVSTYIGRDWTFFLSPRLSWRLYSSREPRDKDGKFIKGERQNRTLFVNTAGFRKQTGESSATSLFFTYQTQSSNMEFERYLPYNYSGFSMGLRFQMEY